MNQPICPSCGHPRAQHDGDTCTDSLCRCPLDLGNPDQED